ncbi:hypothetical protein SAMN04489752_1324 [Brevibacterium siliguriense]|uniref:Dolichyl-phosphate-mannose-protein mannosyltransferase n=1 Tax=Brevibacterium siliguriense TaxID=1136497 RepID=A0A1H1QRU7_9MICO|nr:hypothetical protein [Brevibacterium siliguriense]SDS26033.1 hypothetical protein SAMN04489752_1324 [Brevibacterium siliguriense]
MTDPQPPTDPDPRHRDSPKPSATTPTTSPRLSGSSVRSLLKRPLLWDLLLGALTAAWSAIFLRLFWPGRVNVDIANQYLQATGKIPYSDWHPPVMSAVWRILIGITGDPGSLLLLQVGLLAAAGWGIGVLVHRSGAPRWVSLLGPSIMVTPWVVSQMTTLWKDTQMAVALLLAVVLIMITRFVPKTWLLWLPALVLLVYAVGVRKNAVFAVVPIAVYGGWCLVQLWRKRRGRPILLAAASSLIVLVLIGGGVKVTDAVIDSQMGVTKTGQISQIFLDDVMFSVPDAELRESGAPKELTDHISSAREECLDKGEIWDAYWNCFGKGKSGEDFSPIAHQDALKQLWLDHVITHPLRYVEYRAAVFSYYFFTSGVEYWPAEWHGEATKAGIEQGDPKADFIVRPYVEDFALGTFPMLFTPWFWTLAAVVLLGLAHRAHPWERGGPAHRRSFWPEITTLAASALCYIFGYFPIVPANHFRYTFWPALGLTMAVVLAIAMWRRGPDRDAATSSSAASSKSES